MRAAFLDKDGTVVVDVPYNAEPDRVHLAPGAVEGLRALHDAGYALVVVTNQSGVARGLFPESAVRAVEARLRAMLAVHHIPLAGFYYCPHHPAALLSTYRRHCGCRKPRPGMLRRAARDHGVDLRESWMIGDILDDVEAGLRAGCRTILLLNGHETEWRTGPLRTPDRTAGDLASAARAILERRPLVPSARSPRRGARRAVQSPARSVRAGGAAGL